MKRFTRKGSAIVESAILIPVLVIALWLFICVSIVLMDWSNATFVVADELRMQSIQTAFVHGPISGPMLIKRRVEHESHMLNEFHVTKYRYLFSKNGIDDLIEFRCEGNFGGRNPLNLLSSVNLKQSVLCRAFTGCESLSKDKGEKENDKTVVYIFPGWGKHYHGKGCRTLKNNPMRVVLNRKIRSKYKCCPYSKKKKPKIGNVVMIFPNSGWDYHVPGCSHIEKYYEEILRSDAKQQGYTACAICGGQ